MTNRAASYHPVDSRPPLPPQVSNSYSRSPRGSTITRNYPSRLPTGSKNQPVINNPYMVSNPMPTLDVMESRHYRSYENSPDAHSHLEYGVQRNQYYQNSQFKNSPPRQIQKKENIDLSNSYILSDNGRQNKKNLENPYQPNKQTRAAEEVLRGFESYRSPQKAFNNHYEGYEQVNQSQRQPQSINEYNRYRDIHSNPLPQPYQDFNSFNYNLQNATYQNDRRQQPYEEFNQQDARSNKDQGKYSDQRKATYKPYSLKDYQSVKVRNPVNLGGLGPNTNTDEWYKEREKRDKMTEFSQNVKVFNAQRIQATDTDFKPSKDRDNDRSRRDIALDFAKNIPKPKPRKQSPGLDEEEDKQYKNRKRPESESSRANLRLVVGGGDLNELEQRHNQYVAQLQKTKNK